MGKYTRRRGVILTDLGSRKLNQAKSDKEIEQDFQRYTLESLSQETGLTPNTLSKVFTCGAGVDKRTLKCCFDAFNLTLSADDYLYLKSNQDHLAEINSMLPAETSSHLEPALDCPFEILSPKRSLRQRDRSNTPQTHKMPQSPDDLQPRPPTTPGGQMPLDSVFYIDRPIRESLCYEAIGQPGTLVNIHAPKQMGKTSLMTRILAYGKTQGYHTVSLNLPRNWV